MPRIERYTRGIVRQRAVADTVNPQAIRTAGAGFGAAAEALSFGADIANKMIAAKEATALNETIIANKKRKMDFLDQARQENMSNPVDFHKRMEAELTKIDDEMAEALPTGRSAAAFKERMMETNLGLYQQNAKWAQGREVSMMAERVESATKMSSDMGYTAGLEGRSIDDIIGDAQATVVAAGTILSPEAQARSSRKILSSVYGSYIDGVGERNPYEALKLLQDSKVLSALGADAVANQKIVYQNRIQQARKAAKDASLVEKLLDISTPEANADPFNRDHRKVIDEAFRSSGLVEQIQQGEPTAINELVDIYRNTKIIPESAQSLLRGYSFNGTAEEKATAYTIIGKMQDIDPVMLESAGGFNKKEIADAKIYNDFIRSGASPEYALGVLQKANDPVESRVREMRAEKYKDIKPEKSLSEYARKFLSKDGEQTPWYDVTSWFSGDPDFMGMQNEDMIMRNYSKVFEEEFMRTGSEEAAASGAAAIIGREAGVSYMRGEKEIMMYPPENYYSVPGLTREENAQWMKEEMAESVSSVAPDIDVANTYLIPSADSGYRLDNGMKPIYFVWHEDPETKVHDFLRGDDNRPLVMDFTERRGVEKAAKVIAAKRNDKRSRSLYGTFRPLGSFSNITKETERRKRQEAIWAQEVEVKSGSSPLDLAKDIDMMVDEDAN